MSEKLTENQKALMEELKKARQRQMTAQVTYGIHSEGYLSASADVANCLRKLEATGLKVFQVGKNETAKSSGSLESSKKLFRPATRVTLVGQGMPQPHDEPDWPTETQDKPRGPAYLLAKDDNPSRYGLGPEHVVQTTDGDEIIFFNMVTQKQVTKQRIPVSTTS